MPSIHRMIWNKFHIHRYDILPFTGWAGNRVSLAELFGELGYKLGVEVGVQRGIYSEILCQKVPGLKLKCVDPWSPYHAVNAHKQADIYAQAVERLKPYDAELVRKPSMEAVKDFKDGSLDFVYIDGRHEFDWVMMDLIAWAPKVRLGGIVSGHDYIVGYQMGIIPAVDVYTRSHSIANVYLTRDREPSFFWVQENPRLASVI